MTGTIRVLVCDDSVVIRRLVTDILSKDPQIEVVGTAVNGKVCLEKIPSLKPDVLTLDVEMPVMDGLQTLVEARKLFPKLPVIMFSTLTEKGAGATLDALERGASDYVTKPANVGSVSESMEAVRSQLIPKIKSLAAHKLGGLQRPAGGGFRPAGAVPTGGFRPATASAPAAQKAASPSGTLPLTQGTTSSKVDLVAIGVSTGGPDALTQVISQLPGDFPVPIVVTQHMPPVFTALFAQRLNGKSKLTVTEAKDGDVLTRGHVYIAPGDYHMRLVRRANGTGLRLDQGPQENYCRPAVDPMFRSIPETYGGRVLAVVMTGMGSDGAKGAEHIVRAGGQLVVQDEATSVVWGMPGAVVNAGLPCVVVPLQSLADTIVKRVLTHHGSSVHPGSRS